MAAAAFLTTLSVPGETHFPSRARNCTGALEVKLGTGALMCNPKGIPVILPLFYLLPPPLHLLQLVLQHALCSETMPGPL